MRTYSEKVIDGLLLHEACHVLTLPYTNIYIPDMDDTDMVRFYGNSVTNYDEYLAHVELVKRFRIDPRYEGLKEQQIQLFTNFDTIVNATKMVAVRLQESGQNVNKFQYQVIEQLNAIVYDSLFFFVANDDSFRNWCNDNSLQELTVFVGWIFEDFEYIRLLNLSHRETRRKVMASANFSLSVNPIAIFFNKILFANTTKALHEECIQEDKESDLARMWENRRQAYSS
jgi:hypothetical protein